LPTGIDSVTVDAGHTATVKTNTAKAKSIVLRASATLNYLNAIATLMLGN
jgi:hypothetical protein